MTQPSPDNSPFRSQAVVGLQWGDEGKGKAVDVIAPRHDAVVRYNGGANAGHSVVVGGERFALHLMPSGILTPGVKAVIGNGVVVDPIQILAERDGLEAKGVDCSGLVVSDRAHVVMPQHKAEDGIREALLARGVGEQSGGEPGRLGEIGTTRRGIGPAYAEKVNRGLAVRVGDLLRPGTLVERVALGCELRNAMFRDVGVDVEPLDAHAIAAALIEAGDRLKPCITDTVYLLHEMLAAGKSLLFEGANATLLDVDHGTYPYVTSSSCSVLGIGPGTGVPASRVGSVLGVMKAYTTRVGAGPMPTELDSPVAEHIREVGREYGTTTGRPRRVGWLDLVAAKYSAMVNGATGLCLTMVDVLAGLDEILVCTAYEMDGERTERFLPDAESLERVRPVFESMPGYGGDVGSAERRTDLPANAQAFIERIESFVGVPVEIISVGPEREKTILS
ncbi:MAG: adenylosuccinate synthase [Planctomycetota bacterium]